jgi:hypothetical protein
MADAKTVAAFMTRVMTEQGELFQEDAAFLIWQRWKQFVHRTPKGNLGIHPDVLAEFRAMHPPKKYSQRIWRAKDEHED